MDLTLSRRRWLSVAVVATAGLAGCTRSEPNAPKGSTMTSSQPSSPQPSSPQPSGAQPSGTPSATLRPIDQRLIQAAWDNNLKRATELIAQGADVNAQDQTQQSAYLIATSQGYLELLRLTLAKGAEVNDKDSFNGTGLIRAAERGHHLVVGELLAAGIDKDHVNRIGYQAIHEAIWLGKQTPTYAATVRVLAAGGVQLDRPSGNEGLTPMQMAQQKKFTTQHKTLTILTGKSPSDPDAALLQAATTGECRCGCRSPAGRREARDPRRQAAHPTALGRHPRPGGGGPGLGGAGSIRRCARRSSRHPVVGDRSDRQRGDARGPAARRSRPDHHQSLWRHLADPSL